MVGGKNANGVNGLGREWIVFILVVHTGNFGRDPAELIYLQNTVRCGVLRFT
jgi:hypothetical protein